MCNACEWGAYWNLLDIHNIMILPNSQAGKCRESESSKHETMLTSSLKKNIAFKGKQRKMKKKSWFPQFVKKIKGESGRLLPQFGALVRHEIVLK